MGVVIGAEHSGGKFAGRHARKGGRAGLLAKSAPLIAATIVFVVVTLLREHRMQEASSKSEPRHNAANERGSGRRKTRTGHRHPKPPDRAVPPPPPADDALSPPRPAQAHINEQAVARRDEQHDGGITPAVAPAQPKWDTGVRLSKHLEEGLVSGGIFVSYGAPGSSVQGHGRDSSAALHLRADEEDAWDEHTHTQDPLSHTSESDTARGDTPDTLPGKAAYQATPPDHNRAEGSINGDTDGDEHPGAEVDQQNETEEGKEDGVISGTAEPQSSAASGLPQSLRLAGSDRGLDDDDQEAGAAGTRRAEKRGSSLGLTRTKMRELIEAQQRGGGLVPFTAARKHTDKSNSQQKLRLVSSSALAAKAGERRGHRPARPAAQQLPALADLSRPDQDSEELLKGHVKRVGGKRGSSSGYLYQDEEDLTNEEKAAREEQRQRQHQAEIMRERNRKSIERRKAEKLQVSRNRDSEKRRAESGHESFEFIS